MQNLKALLKKLKDLHPFHRMNQNAKHSFKVISVEDLIRVKEAMKRPKDLQAAKELQLIQLKLKR